VLAALATATDTSNKEYDEGGTASPQDGREGEIEEDGREAHYRSGHY